MRKLYFVPIIHMSADMGSVAPALDERATAELGPELWQKHKEVISGFWDSIARFFDSLDVTGFKVYQDGLIADGEGALKIVNQGVREGSPNYEIILHLLQRGATLVKTEDISLVKEEYAYVTKMAQAKSLRQREITALRYRLAQGRLLQQRDIFIATRINETLKEGETGILFIGAYHNVVPRLAADIKVIQVKEVAKVKAYHQALTKARKYDQRLHEFAGYLTSSIVNTSS